MKDNDRFFVNLVKEGYLSISDSGMILNNKTKNCIGAVGSGKYLKISVKDLLCNKIRHMQIHRLVYLIYAGDIPKNLQINHKDGNKLNNNLNNLELVTNGENVKHSIRLGFNVPKKGGEKPNAIFTDSEVITFREKFKNGEITINEICNEFNCHTLTVKEMLRGKTYSHLKNSIDIKPKPVGSTKKYLNYLDEIKKLKEFGLSCEQIGLQLNISRSTVQKYIKERS